jgi:hypothetical protein
MNQPKICKSLSQMMRGSSFLKILQSENLFRVITRKRIIMHLRLHRLELRQKLDTNEKVCGRGGYRVGERNEVACR